MANKPFITGFGKINLIKLKKKNGLDFVDIEDFG